MNKVRIGVIGMGIMGAGHAGWLSSGRVKRCELTAVHDVDPERCACQPQVKCFKSSADLIRSGDVDAVVIATPHYSHTDIGIDALEHGLHVMVEKPVSVHKADCERMIAAHTNSKLVFAAMFNQRTDPYYQKIRGLVSGGELGEIRRINWVITSWFRTGAYYRSGAWRATWAGEGGGVLLNQCPHNLDLYQWMFGMPDRVRAFCKFGRYHDIEVEDDVTAYFEHPNGATGVIITSTGEAPGTNRLEVAGERGRLVLENDVISFMRNEIEMSEFSRISSQGFDRPQAWDIRIPVSGHGGQHVEMLQNFVDASLDGAPLIAPASEGARSIELANAILLSTFDDKTIELPMDGKAYEIKLKDKISASTRAKKTGPALESGTLSKSFNK
ncbi:MAG: Gfo/Idh/MocA family oxidoreductase [bacterium]|nr:Gfo/Idh/MocA family oxidoreductase [Candidatus Sumerlaeota bacterium]